MLKNNLSAVMGARRVKIAQVSAMSGIARSTITAIYYDRVQGIRLSTLMKLCDCLQVPLSELMEYTPKGATNKNESDSTSD